MAMRRVATGGMVGGHDRALAHSLGIFAACPEGSFGDAFVGITAGVHWTFAMLLAAWAAGMGPWLRSRFGLSGTLLFSTLFVTILNASMWLAVQHQIMTVVAVALALGRSMPRAVTGHRGSAFPDW